MSIFVEVLKRNFILEKVTQEKIDELLALSKITQEEYNFIVNL